MKKENIGILYMKDIETGEYNMKLQLILDLNNQFIALLDGDIDAKCVATESTDQVIEINIGD